MGLVIPPHYQLYQKINVLSIVILHKNTKNFTGGIG